MIISDNYLDEHSSLRVILNKLKSFDYPDYL